MGIVLDSAGDLWLTDGEGDQVQEWMTGAFLFSGCRFGSFGTGSGQFSHPADVAPDGKGNLWVLDRGNSRLEKFNEKGEFVVAAGSQGTGAGKLSSPAGLAIDPSGNLWVADTANNRIEEFSEKGEFILTFGREVNKTKVEAGGTSAEKSLCTAASGNVCQAGVLGNGDGQMNAPQGIAMNSGDAMWVADTGNNRLQKFGPTGTFANKLASEGSEAGKVKEPTAVALGPGGSVWVADAGNNRVEEWNSSLGFVRQFGSEGTGNGQFKRPAALDVDSSGNVWVADQNNQRLQEFTETGAYVAQLGGSAQLAFSGPMGLATDGKGSVWVTDTDHNRVQKFPTAEFTEPVITQAPAIDYTYSSGALTKMELKEPGTSTDPALNVSLSSGLTSNVASEEAGTTTYHYESGNLTAKTSPEGETKYTRDSNNRLTKVELPNGTWAKVAYDSIGRATEVTLKPAGGAEKTTHFWYGNEPRETRVWGTEHPEVIYSINEEGSVFKWEYAEVPPTIEDPTGSLWANRGNEVENKDQTLFVHASSQNEIASIKVLQNSNAVVAETTCEDNSTPPAHNCDNPPPLEWITNPSEFAPGQLNLEIVATDFTGHSSAKAFWVTIPQQPAPDPEADVPPDFESTKKFREDYGLDRANPLTQPQLNKLVLELLYEWEAQSSAAVASVEEWGVPMRAPELAEMNYRREYIDRDSEVIPQWAEEHAPNTYAGFYVDDRAGGVIHVGFTENQAATIEALKGDSRLINSAQIQAFPSAPATSLKSLEEMAPSVSAALAGDPKMSKVTSSIHAGPEGNVIHVGATDVSGVTTFLHERFGTSAPITVELESRPFNTASRYAGTGPIVGGSALVAPDQEECTAGYSARARSGETAAGKSEYKYFTLTAGHCFPMNEKVWRQTARDKFQGSLIGEVRRDAYRSANATDGEGVWIAESHRSYSVLEKGKAKLEDQPVEGVQAPRNGEHVCWSGVQSGVRCGEIIWHGEEPDENYYLKVIYRVRGLNIDGDSGAPVWDKHSHKAVGVLSGGSDEAGGGCWILPNRHRACTRTDFTPLLPSGGAAGILPELGVHLLTQGE
jgi:YD repeat-containing protein